MKVCCGGILGMGESEQDRVDMLVTLANLPEAPESVPINMLIPIPGTPMAKATPIGPIEFVRIVALARIMMPSLFRATFGGAVGDDRRDAGAVLLCRCKLDLCRRHAADGGQSAGRSRSKVVPPARTGGALKRDPSGKPLCAFRIRAFSSEVDAGSREENASK